MYKFLESNQSPWLADIYNTHLDHKTDGFFVEVGVGHTIAGVDQPDDLHKILDAGLGFSRLGSNTADLIDLGWSGIYIEPIEEFCYEASICHAPAVRDGRLSIVKAGASDVESTETLFQGETFIPAGYTSPTFCYYEGRIVPTQITSKILEYNHCPERFDLMSVDVEGYEHKVIMGMEFTKHRPKLLVVEVNRVPADYIESLLPDGYHLFGHDGLNAAWVDTQW